MNRSILMAGSMALALAAVSAAQAEARSPIIYNRQGNMVGVLDGMKPNGDAIMLPTQATVGMGYYDVVMPAANLRPRARGGWETSLSNEAIAFLPPVTRRFFMPSGI